MHDSINKKVFITGGSSGLGLELVKKFCSSGYQVITISREKQPMESSWPNLRSICCDLSSLAEVRKFADQIRAEGINFEIVINNAGVLSPPKFIKTVDGFEFSYQVNFLSQYLLTRLLLKSDHFHPKLIVNVSSPIYKNGSFDLPVSKDKSDYKLFRAYASTKLYMALFNKKLAEEGWNSFSFNPGTFNSGIYRHQDKWFHYIYKLASPFMTSSQLVAQGLFQSIVGNHWENGRMVNKRGQFKDLVSIEDVKEQSFWKLVDSQLSAWLT